MEQIVKLDIHQILVGEYTGFSGIAPAEDQEGIQQTVPTAAQSHFGPMPKPSPEIADQCRLGTPRRHYLPLAVENKNKKIEIKDKNDRKRRK